jgi:hypothetical protein
MKEDVNFEGLDIPEIFFIDLRIRPTFRRINVFGCHPKSVCFNPKYALKRLSLALRSDIRALFLAGGNTENISSTDVCDWVMYLEPDASLRVPFPIIASPVIHDRVMATISQMTIEEARAAAWAAWERDHGRGSYFGISFEQFGQQAVPALMFSPYFIDEEPAGRSSGRGKERITDCRIVFESWCGIDTFISGIAGLELKDGIYYRPQMTNFPCLDSLARTKWKVIDLDGNEVGRFEGMIAFQFTIDEKHNVADPGRAAKEFAAFLDKKKDSEGVPWFIFVLAHKEQFRWFKAVIDEMDKKLLNRVRIFTMILPLNEPLVTMRTSEKARRPEPVNLAEVESNAKAVVGKELPGD